MGKIVAFSRPSPLAFEVFSPVNYRPTERCKILVFDSADGNGYQERFDAVGVQYAVGEMSPQGYHVIEKPGFDGPVLRYTKVLPGAKVCVKEWKGQKGCRVYPLADVRFVGRVFQFIRD